MSDKQMIHIVAMECPAGAEDKFNQWYNTVHVPMLLRFPGILGATRYRITKPGDDYPTYLAIYRFRDKAAFEAYGKSKELADTIAETNKTWRPDELKIRWRVQYEVIKEWSK